jgi:hypothetical protein
MHLEEKRMKRFSFFLLTTALILAIGTTAIAALKNKQIMDEWDPTTSFL